MRFKKLTDHLIPLSLAAGLVACSSAKPTPDAAAAKAEEKSASVAEAPKTDPSQDANAAKRYLGSMGARDNQLAAISFGDQKPKATGHDEEAWRQNRRDDLSAIPASYQSR